MSVQTCRKCDRVVPPTSCGLCSSHQDPTPARSSDAIVAAARGAFCVGYVAGREGLSCGEGINIGALFARWWNTAAGFDEVKP